MSNVEEKKAFDEQMIKEEFDALLKDYLNSNHRRKVEKITKVFNFSKQAHANVRRRSGEPYIMHPLAVARIVCSEMGLGSTSICSALLHDVVEDTDYTVEDIKNMFGEKISQIVDGLTKISGGIFGEQASEQAENFRRLLLTMNNDIRVVLIKIADRLHNMRTLGAMPPAKQYKIAGETIYLYAPLAHRLGLFTIKSELEDLSFKYEHPKEYKSIYNKIKATEEQRNTLFEHFAEPVRAKLNEMGLTYEMRARIKSAYSIWNKIHSKDITFEDVYDLFAARIIFEPLPDIDEKKLCWNIYAAITDIYRIKPDRIRDWVSRPKANGYQALHLTVMGPDGQWIEIQIRSRRMDDIAEKGFAAHWKYKGDNIEEDTELGKWLQTIKEILDNPDPNALDFLDTIKMNLYASEIFVFTPKGELKTLPQGATALDFAYAIHTNVGNTCIGAKVNHKLTPLSHILSSGDQVEVLTSRSQAPQAEWLNFVTTAKARTKIEAALRKIKRNGALKGEEKVLALFKQAGVEADTDSLNKLAMYFGFPKREDFFYSVEQGNVALPDNIKKLLTNDEDSENKSLWSQLIEAFRINSGKKKKRKKRDGEENEPDLKVEEKEEPKFDKSKPYILKEEAFEHNYIISQCCKPIPGDDAIGFINKDNKVVVHKRSCPIATKLKSSFGERILNTEWSSHKNSSFDATLEMQGIDSIGVLSTITQIISNEFNVNIQRLLVEAKDGVFEGKIKLKVHDVEDIQRLCLTLSKIKNIKSVGRVAD
ncbi:MAG: RelA/SpoT family protein [Tannerellaceae bacterium]|jgi:GTP pyrophosphokinase|nr:RelA/SpoT family protein [Tannerellaceae bacterium]